jgi:hypothetical protein
MTLTALPLTSAGRFWPLGPFGIAILPVSCALSHVLNGHHGRSAFVRLTLYMNGDSWFSGKTAAAVAFFVMPFGFIIYGITRLLARFAGGSDPNSN